MPAFYDFVNIWQDETLRQSGRTTRMIAAAVLTAATRHVVIVGASAHHVDELKRLHEEAVEEFARFKGSRFPSDTPIFKDSADFAQHLRSATSFVYVGERSACSSWPNQPVIFVDDYAQSKMVERTLRESGF